MSTSTQAIAWTSLVGSIWLVLASSLWAGPHLASASTPHPAVARIIVPEQGATSYGSGTLIDVREQYGLVVTNWHVIRDATGTIEVVFPNGFRSPARPLKLDRDWDLAALVIWRPEITPVTLATQPPRPGEPLTIAGYGQGNYLAATGRCLQYLAPGINLPEEMVEVSVQARQGDSGGPILNQHGELAGVLFGASHGTTMGSYAGRVSGFLVSIAPDLTNPARALAAQQPASPVQPVQTPETTPAPVEVPEETFVAADAEPAGMPAVELSPIGRVATRPGKPQADHQAGPADLPGYESYPGEFSNAATVAERYAATRQNAQHRPSAPVTALAPGSNRVVSQTAWQAFAGSSLLEQIKTALATLGALWVLLIGSRVALAQ